MIRKSKSKLLIVVHKGMVDAVYCSQEDLISETEIIDLDLTDPNDIRRNKLREKKARKSMKQIY